MDRPYLPLAVTLGFSFLGVVGDYFLKIASGADNPFKTVAFYVGFTVYGSTAFGWLFVMRHLKLATISTVYSVSIILLLTATGAVFFEEKLSTYEIAGILMALGSLVLLVRFA
jgi:small multidrug resistance pump